MRRCSATPKCCIDFSACDTVEEVRRRFVVAGGHRLEVETIAVAPGRPTIVLLHEGLGSVATWRDFPRRLARAVHCNAVVYSRYGYGRSDALAGPRTPAYLHEEALVALPELLDALEIAAPILFGHSDGASIALIHAGAAARPVGGVVAVAPHVMVEEMALLGIGKTVAAYTHADLRQRLARYHDDVDAAFFGWSRIWLAPAFRDWSIEDCLAQIRCPVLAIQGTDDEYGTMEHLRRIAAQGMDTTLVELAHCGHSPHRDRPDVVITAMRDFVARIPR